MRMGDEMLDVRGEKGGCKIVIQGGKEWMEEGSVRSEVMNGK